MGRGSQINDRSIQRELIAKRSMSPNWWHFIWCQVPPSKSVVCTVLDFSEPIQTVQKFSGTEPKRTAENISRTETELSKNFLEPNRQKKI
jgi:hypothetical protein